MGKQFETHPMNTTYFPEDLVRVYVGGGCASFAYAVHGRTGWPLVILWEENHDTGEKTPSHVFCIAPDGQGIDIEGLHTLDALKTLYANPYRKDRPLTVQTFGSIKDLLTSLDEENEFYAFVMGEDDRKIRVTNQRIDRSPAFLTLLQSLIQPKAPTPPTPAP